MDSSNDSMGISQKVKKYAELGLYVALLAILILLAMSFATRGGIPLLHGVDKMSWSVVSDNEAFMPGRRPRATGVAMFNRVK